MNKFGVSLSEAKISTASSSLSKKKKAAPKKATGKMEPPRNDVMDVSMQFCPTCSNLLLVDKAAATYRFQCQTCPYVHDISRRVVRRVQLQRKQLDDVLGGEAAWKNGATMDTDCPKCGHKKAFFKQIQTRSADEPMTEFYKCAERVCGHQWKEG